ncbi:MAG: hypothetical protein M9905_17550 [Rhizobiaceae bacterium]|nr:hypothetical protein [Rhizobiaceae bacterium]
MRLNLAVVSVVTFGSIACASDWPAAESYMNASFICGNHPSPRDCEFGMFSFPQDYAKAIKGDYQGQKNVAYCFETGCSWAVKENQTLACAWHVVIMGSGHLQLDEYDRRYADLACKKLDRIGRKTAERQAETMLRLLGVK